METDLERNPYDEEVKGMDLVRKQPGDARIEPTTFFRKGIFQAAVPLALHYIIALNYAQT